MEPQIARRIEFPIVIHKVIELPTTHRLTLLCAPMKLEAVVQSMQKSGRARTDWDGVNCPTCRAKAKGPIPPLKVR